MTSEYYTFGPYKISSKEVFYTTPLSFAFVNLRPVLPVVLEPIVKKRYTNNHSVVTDSWREVKRFVDLTAEETNDLWLAAKKIGGQLEIFHKASSLTFTIQDGPDAGQTVPHVHVHILPRKAKDFKNNDEIYDAIDEKGKELKQKLNLDQERKDRSLDEMTQEADDYRKLFSIPDSLFL
ncbi:hypothetical protein CDL15_Pgr024856 [Punica granatum]|uniref:HIT domain-containing protein n=1 Tax=Punica granatum TaxID=22663 RepID=A0A218Y4S8_PUNGR|nr:hypothetical protein CDL15_Pgr024856 [Punica granatum]